MKNQFKLEIAALGLFSILLLLARMDLMPNFVHLFYALLISVYFFPIRLVMKKENDTTLVQVLSSFVVSSSIVIISLITTVGNENQYLVGALAMLSLLNLVGAFYYFSKSAQKMAVLHLAVQFMLSMYFF
jgi:hypothetical protein